MPFFVPQSQIDYLLQEVSRLSTENSFLQRELLQARADASTAAMILQLEGRRGGGVDRQGPESHGVSSQAGLASLLRGLATNPSFGHTGPRVEVQTVEVIPHTRADCDNPEECPVHAEGSPWAHEFDFLERGEGDDPDVDSGDVDPAPTDNFVREETPDPVFDQDGRE